MSSPAVADYVIVRLIGEGNHGRLFLATPPSRLSLGPGPVALKQVAGTTTDDEYARVVDEMARLVAIGSPHLFTVYEVGRQDGSLFYSMAYEELGSLAAPARPLTRQEVVRAVAHAARGAHALHEAGMAHRDIKPSNVLLHEGGARLADLGVAHLMNPGQTFSGMGPLMSLEYMEPALIRGEAASRASDIWALGATLHRVLSGASLYGEIPSGNTLRALQHVASTPPVLHPSVPPAEAQVISRCLAAEPGARPYTAEELALQLEALA